MPQLALYRVLANLTGALLLSPFAARANGAVMGAALITALVGAVLVGSAARRARSRSPWVRGAAASLRVVLHAVALLAASSLEWRTRPPVVPEALAAVLAQEGGPVIWIGRITGIPVPTAAGTDCVLALAGAYGSSTAPGSSPAGGRVLVGFPGVPPAPGEWWVVRGRLVRPPPQRNPGGFDPRARAARIGIAGRIQVMRASGARCLSPPPPAPTRPDLALAAWIARVRARSQVALSAEMRPVTAGLAMAMSLGMRGSLAPETNATFRALGWSHLIAVSGLNVGFVAGLAAALLHVVRAPGRAPALALIMVVYAVMTGGEAPVVRAAVMGLAALLARATERSLTTGRSLGLAALLGLAAAPHWLGDPGFQLSFAALAGMAALGPRVDWSHPMAWLAGRGLFARAIGLPLLAGMAAQIGCLPILTTTFHSVSVWGIVTGPVAVPLSGLFVSAVLLGLSLRALPGPLGDASLAGGAVLGETLIAASRLGARHLSAPWPVPAPGPVAIAFLVIGVAMVAPGRRRPGVRGAGVLLVLLVSGVMVAGIPAAPGPPERVDVVFLDVGQGDAALIVAYGPPGLAGWLGLPRRPQAVIVVDAGDHPVGGFDCGAGIVAPALAAAGARRIDVFIATHGDRDHVGGLDGLAEAMPIGEILWPAPYRPPPAIRALAGAPGRSRRRLVAAGDTLFARPGLLLTALHPPPRYGGGENDGSIVVLVTAAGKRVLMAGDVEAPGEAVICGSQQEIEADVVKVAHHGSPTSSTPGFVAATGARHAVVSVGIRNRFGHPAPAVLARWEGAGARVWRTDRGGAIIVTLGPGPLRVRSFVRE